MIATTNQTCVSCGREYPSPASDTNGMCWRCQFDAQFIPAFEQAWIKVVSEIEARAEQRKQAALAQWAAYISIEHTEVDYSECWADIECELFVMPCPIGRCENCGHTECCCIRVDVDHWIIDERRERFLDLADDYR